MAQFPRLPPWIAQNAQAQFARQATASLGQSFLQGVQSGQEQKVLQQERKELKALKREMGGFLKGLSEGDLSTAAQHSDVFTNQTTAGPASQALMAFMRNQRIEKRLKASERQKELSEVQEKFFDQTLQGLKDETLPPEAAINTLELLNNGQPFQAMKALQKAKSATTGAAQAGRQDIDPETLAQVQDDIVRVLQDQKSMDPELREMSTREMIREARELARETLRGRTTTPPSREEIGQAIQTALSEQQGTEKPQGRSVTDFLKGVLGNIGSMLTPEAGGFGERVEPHTKIERDEQGNLKLPE